MLETSKSAGGDGDDWSGTALGARAHWPHTLRLAVDIVLNHPSPMLLSWGAQAIPVFNSAYAALAGAAHPGAPGGKAMPQRPAPLAANPAAFERAAMGEAQQLRHQRLDFAQSAYFDLYLTPLADEHGHVGGVLCALGESSTPLAAEAGAGLRVLVVEDNLDSQFLVCEMLKAFGHEADGVAHAEGALAMLEQVHYQVLLSDVSLPGMSGVELARQALRIAPSLRVVFASGYGDTLLRHVEFPYQSLQKPYDLEQLQGALASIGAAPHSGPR